MIEDYNPICTTQRTETVSNGNGRSAFHQILQGFLNLPLGLGIHSTGRFVENEQPGINQ